MAKVPVLVEIDIEFDTQTSVWHIQWHKKQVPIFYLFIFIVMGGLLPSSSELINGKPTGLPSKCLGTNIHHRRAG
jgi:hypothetical protein